MTNQTKVGILGGGQLGRMLIQSAISYDIQTKILDPNPEAPVRAFAHEFVIGKLTDYQTVMDFGQDCDVLSIEIENVNTQALEALETQGKKVYPQPHIIRLIQNKRSQKTFYKENNIPTADFHLIDSKDELENHLDFLPAVQKLAQEGYDGRGVQKLKSKTDLNLAFEAPSLIEKLVDIEKEVSIIIARNPQGQIEIYPPVELVFNPNQNLVDYLLSPAQITEEQTKKMNQIAQDLIEKLDFVGLLAVELFLTKSGEILVNEIAPRTHNSGHQTIEANFTSQFEQHLRAILNAPLGNTDNRCFAAMINILGEEGYTGKVKYEGIEQILAQKGFYVHLYGKKITKPFRKMGHITILGENRQELIQKIEAVKKEFRVISI
jgi:5-(carboxyamino)imidazole ribonucleotide synthase